MLHIDYIDNPAKQCKVKELGKQTDQMVYGLYGLTADDPPSSK